MDREEVDNFIVFYNSYYETYLCTKYSTTITTCSSYYRCATRRTTQRLSFSSDFPSQDLSEDDDFDNGIQFQRRNYDQGKIGSIPTDRLAMIHSTNSNNEEEEDDEWDSYLDMNVDSDGNYVQNNGIDNVNYNHRDNGIGKNDISTRVEQTQVNDVQQIESDAGQSLGNGGYESRKVHTHRDKDDSIEIINEEQQPRTNEHTRLDESVDDLHEHPVHCTHHHQQQQRHAVHFIMITIHQCRLTMHGGYINALHAGRVGMYLTLYVNMTIWIKLEVVERRNKRDT